MNRTGPVFQAPSGSPQSRGFDKSNNYHLTIACLLTMQIARTSFGNLSREMLSVKFQCRLSLEQVRKRKAASRERRTCFASTRETLELRAAFSRIESPVYRRMIIET